MDEIMKKNVTLYKNVICQNSNVEDFVTLGDDVFVLNSNLGKFCSIDRRNIIVNGDIGDYTYTGHNTVIKFAKIGKFCSISWNVSIGGPEHDYGRISVHPFAFYKKHGISDENIPGCYPSIGTIQEIGNDVWIA